MWKVKRMITARIVVLTIAVGVGGLAAYPANGSDNRPLPTEPAVQSQTADVSVATSGIGPGQSVATGRDDIIKSVRYGALRPTTTLK
jgi:pilus assembly protein CpaB